MRIFTNIVNDVGELLPTLVGNRGSGAGEILSDVMDQWSESNREWLKENTIKSIDLAINSGLKWIKVEAYVARDNKVVISSSNVLDSGKSIIELDIFEIHQLGLVCLEEVFEKIEESIGFIIEVKHIFEDLDGWGSTESISKALIRESILRPNRPIVAYGLESSTALVMKHTIKEYPIQLGYSAYDGSDFVEMIISAKRFGLKVVIASVHSLVGGTCKSFHGSL